MASSGAQPSFDSGLWARKNIHRNTGTSRRELPREISTTLQQEYSQYQKQIDSNRNLVAAGVVDANVLITYLAAVDN